jgi:pantothenate kinase
MEEQVTKLVDNAWALFQETPPDKRFRMSYPPIEDNLAHCPEFNTSAVIAIAGIPGSGKTTLSTTVTARLNAKQAALKPGTPEIAAFVPMDGYHFTRAHLSSMPDPDYAHARRGAAFTFDAQAFHSLVQSISRPLAFTPDASSSTATHTSIPKSPSVIYAPSFDHALKDPVENDIPILPTHRIVVFEGNYLALDKEPWSGAARLMDQLWFVEVDFAVAERRLVKRHLKSGIANREEEAVQRARENDLVNGEEIIQHRLRVDEVVVSRECDAWAHE